MASYLKTFFAEKNLDERTYEIEASDGNLHLVDSGIVIEALHNASAGERSQAADIIRKIDFLNGDVHHFLEHLAKGYVETNFVST